MSIQLAEALREMEKTVNGRPVPFSVSYWKCDLKKKIAGDLVELHNVTLSRKKTSATGSRSAEGSSSFSRKPNHYENATRNFVHQNHEIRKGHIYLIETFNGQEVHW